MLRRSFLQTLSVFALAAMGRWELLFEGDSWTTYPRWKNYTMSYGPVDAESFNIAMKRAMANMPMCPPVKQRICYASVGVRDKINELLGAPEEQFVSDMSDKPEDHLQVTMANGSVIGGPKPGGDVARGSQSEEMWVRLDALEPPYGFPQIADSYERYLRRKKA